MDRIFKPGVYRHFKEDKPLSQRMYYGIAQTIPSIKSQGWDVDPRTFSVITRFMAHHTETGEIVEVVLCADGLWRTDKDESFVFYKALYGGMYYYVRPVEMFLSPRDADKYPEYSQYYRMEKIS